MSRSLRGASALPFHLTDLERFVADLSLRLDAGSWPQDHRTDDRQPVFVARAPGRLDVMGGIADYSGALVLQLPIREATRVALRPWAEPRLSITSIGHGGVERRCDVPLDVVADPHRTYEQTRAWFAAEPERHWAAYVGGVFHVLSREHALRPAGAAILIDSSIPEGKGVSSSAAIEAATMEAVLGAWPAAIEPRTRALLCQRVENLIVGAPCGVMDQMASICGEADSLMALLCQPAELRDNVRLPEGLGVWGIDSGIRHAVSGADYSAVRVGAFMGYRMLAELAGLQVEPGERDGHVRVDDPQWRGYLANVGGDAFTHFAPHLPQTLGGRDFLARYGGTTDLVTRVDPACRYAVRVPTAHPVYEHERVTEWFGQLREAGGSKRTRPTTGESERTRPTWDATRLGALMYESHESYSACGLGSDGTDRLVALARAAGAAGGIYGAKITGGGSGGTVAILADAGAGDAVRSIAARYTDETGRDAHVFEGSSPGAAVVGAVRLDPVADAGVQ